MSNLVEKESFSRALQSRNIDGIMPHLGGTNVNIDVGGRVFDIMLSIGGRKVEKGFRILLENPNWNPNYRSVDAWHPEERAMIHHRQDLALQVIKHPNFNKKEYPRVIQSANLLKAPKVLSFLGQHTRT